MCKISQADLLQWSISYEQARIVGLKGIRTEGDLWGNQASEYKRIFTSKNPITSQTTKQALFYVLWDVYVSSMFFVNLATDLCKRDWLGAFGSH